MEKPYDEKRLARAVHDILRYLLATKFIDYYSKLSSIVLADSMRALSSSSINGRYDFVYRFARVFGPPDFTRVTIIIDNPVKPYAQVSSYVGLGFNAFAEVEIANKLLNTYYGYFDTDKENPVLKRFANKSIEKLSRRNERIRSTLTAIVEAATREILQEAPPSVREYIGNIARIELEDISIKTRDNKLTVAAKYVFVKKFGMTEIANIGIRFKDEFLTVDDVWIFTEPYAMPQDYERCFPHMLITCITKCIERDFCRMINALGASEWLGGCPCKYCKEEKEKKEMTVPKIQYTLNDIPVPKPFVNESTYDKIRSTLKKIVTDTIGENFDYIIEWRFELEKTPLRASAQYKLIEDGYADALHVVLIFKDEDLDLEVVSVSAEDDRIREMAACLPHEIRVRFTLLFNEDEDEDEKEKEEMTTAEASYIYDVKMASEMKRACDKLAEGSARLAYREASNAVYGAAEALAVGAENKKLSVKEIVINEPAMIVFWEDGTKTVVTARDDAFDAEKGLAMAFAKKALGNNYAAGGRFKAKLKHAKWAPKKQEKKKGIFCEENLRGDAKEVIEETKKRTKEKPITKTAWIKSMMEEGFTRSEATKAWEKKHQK